MEDINFFFSLQKTHQQNYNWVWKFGKKIFHFNNNEHKIMSTLSTTNIYTTNKSSNAQNEKD